MSWGSTFRTTVDGMIYGLRTGGVFGRPWPSPAVHGPADSAGRPAAWLADPGVP